MGIVGLGQKIAWTCGGGNVQFASTSFALWMHDVQEDRLAASACGEQTCKRATLHCEGKRVGMKFGGLVESHSVDAYDLMGSIDIVIITGQPVGGGLPAGTARCSNRLFPVQFVGSPLLKFDQSLRSVRISPEGR